MVETRGIEPNAAPHPRLGDPWFLRRQFGHFVTVVAIVTIVTIVTPTGTACEPVGVTANSFACVSLGPPLVLWSLSLSARSLGSFRKADRFAVNVLPNVQRAIASGFARSGSDEFAPAHWSVGTSVSPLIDGAAAQIECAVTARFPGGDHEIAVDRAAAAAMSERQQIAFHRWRFVDLPRG
jgi:flavin reductase (DIM6/NTAB) family NADH-FMN oxidoreductase RutF